MTWHLFLLVAHVHVDRLNREVYVLDEAGAVVHQEPAGIGRGGLKDKTTMSDLVTPTGTFTVDLVVSQDGRHNAISAAHRTRWAGDATYGRFVDQEDGLAQLYANMSSLDFNGDGSPDRAYGTAYVGLDAKDVVTGPKMRQYRGTPYWYSIALHGTPDPANLGQARSGGCVHLSADLLTRLITDGTLSIGQKVVIADGPPKAPSAQ